MAIVKLSPFFPNSCLNLLNSVLIELKRFRSNSSSSLVKPGLPLKEKMPETKDARQILLENPNMTFIGVYHSWTGSITLMPAMPNKLCIEYNDSNSIVSASYDQGGRNKVSEAELQLIKRDYKFFIPRYCITRFGIFTAHEKMIANMNVIYQRPYYGFSVVLNDNMDLKIIGTSISLNANKANSIDGQLPIDIRKKIEKIIYSWLEYTLKNNKYLNRPNVGTTPKLELK